MRLGYFGTAGFAVPALEALADSVVLVVSQPDRPSGRGMKLRPSEVKARAMELGLPVETPEKARDPEFIARIKELNLDALAVAAYGQILPVSLLESARRGGINLHGSLLPLLRGAAPIQRCLLEGHTHTGITLMQMDRGMDSGDIIAMESIEINPAETAGELTPRLAALAAQIAAEWMPRITAGEYPRQPQDHEAATYAPKIEKSEAEIKFDEPASLGMRRYQAFTPAPGAWVNTARGSVKIGAARLAEGTCFPGTVMESKGKLVVAHSEGALEWVTIQPAGQKSMSGADYANGNRLRPGDVLI